MDINDILTHLGEDRANYFNAVAPPVIQSSNFVFNSVEHMRSSFADEFNQHIYTRGNNPTVTILRKKLALGRYDDTETLRYQAKYQSLIS